MRSCHGSPAAVICIRQRVLPRSRTQTGSLWEASAEIDGKSYSAVSRHGAPQALARVLIAAGVEDQPAEVRSEVCVFDSGAEIRTVLLRGCIRYRSFHTMGKTTFAESATAPLRRTRFEEQPEGLFLRSGEGENAFHRPPDDIVAVPGSVTPKITVGTEERPCATCGRIFRPWRPQAAYCSQPCRQRAYRQRTAHAAGMPVEETTL
jgi:hypothetical protein